MPWPTNHTSLLETSHPRAEGRRARQRERARGPQRGRLAALSPPRTREGGASPPLATRDRIVPPAHSAGTTAEIAELVPQQTRPVSAPPAAADPMSAEHLHLPHLLPLERQP